jgi:hypothetical protein
MLNYGSILARVARGRASMSMGALLVSLTAIGCGDEGNTDTDELAAQSDDLRRPGKKKDAGTPVPGDAAAESPCNLIDCRDGQRCELHEVQCIRAPCPPVAECVPIKPPTSCAATSCVTGTTCVETPTGAQCVPASTCAATSCLTGTTCKETPTGAECVPVSTCAATLCKTGTKCVDSPDGAQCLPFDPAPGCALTLCKTGTTCVEGPTGAECVPVSTCAATTCPVGDECVEGPSGATCKTPCLAKCSAGNHCELHEVQCIRAPCPPQPTCVPDEPKVDACSTVRCKAGTHCEVITVQCFVAPCPEQAQCISDPQIPPPP